MGAVSTSKKSSAGKNVLVFFIVFMILEMLIIFGIGKVFKNKDVTPSVLGYSLFITKEDLIQTVDNSPVVAVPKNVLVIASDGVNDIKNKIGCPILCENVENEGTGVYWLANLDYEDGKDGFKCIVSNGGKQYVINNSDAIGICGSYFVTAGKVINFVTQKFGMICCAVVPLFLLVLIELIIAIATHSPEEEDDEEEDEEEGEKNVQLDDFLFGGKSEGEQIAKRRKKPVLEEDDEEEDDDIALEKPVKAPHAGDFDFDIEVRKATKAPSRIPDIQGFSEQPVQQPSAKPDFDPRAFGDPQAQAYNDPRAFYGAQPEAAPQQDNGSLRLKDDEYYEKASQLVEGSEAPVRPARRPAGQRPRRRRPVSSSNGANGADSGASLEDLMKLMEEEQSKLKSRMK
ncbi:hypothetical protein [Ruminococcus albus]|uniref:Uncharacterized protein n=1 Tax=Ruminococcus albus TaxID=1264 RepID=A0A1I1P1D1_RUMAL|nr:hypothetical protein [Ruminococcus albus]SFD03382.1 hypothetical protein SAMN02910406_02926 [Ruminococcus albus]